MPQYEEWTGRQRTAEDTVSLERARKLAATLDRDPAALGEGDPLPPGWHWTLFHEPVRRAGLADDGHEARGAFLPPIPLPRRMWAGGTVRFLRDLHIGTMVERVSTVRSVERKEGRSGRLAFVTVEHLVSDAGGVAIEEEQRIVYAERPSEGWAPPARIEPAGVVGAPGDTPRDDAENAGGGSGERLGTFCADEVTLFRFSALTFNGHRIHYDQSFAREKEGYPDVVVHGPLVALQLLEASRGWRSGLPGPFRFTYRALQPLFCGEKIDLMGARSGAVGSPPPLVLWAEHAARGVVMRAELGGPNTRA